VNVWGTIIAVLILAVGISGIQQMGASFFIEPLFNGLTLIVAVGLAGYFARRRLRVAVALPDPIPPAPSQTPSSPPSQGAPTP
jgi:ribose transport system permease protein